MKKVFQTITDSGHGNCMQAAMASIFDMELEDVPNFIEFKNWFEPMKQFILERGYKYEGMLHNKQFSFLTSPTYECFHEKKWYKPAIMTRKKLYKHEGINGLFYASVLSPRFFNYTSGFTATHAVIIDKDYNIVHDPNPAYQEILCYPLADLLKYNGIISLDIINPVSK